MADPQCETEDIGARTVTEMMVSGLEAMVLMEGEAMEEMDMRDGENHTMVRLRMVMAKFIRTVLLKLAVKMLNPEAKRVESFFKKLCCVICLFETENLKFNRKRKREIRSF